MKISNTKPKNQYNLDTLISTYIHRPIITGKDLPPLYARSGSENETAFDAEGMKDPDWQKVVLTRYNSPTNVRRLFIGDKKVYIQYYQPPVNKTTSSSGRCWVTYNISPDEQLDKIAARVINHNSIVQQAIMQGTQAPKAPNITKTGLGAISNHWKMSNIEEIYITPSILVSIDIRSRFNIAEQVYTSMIKGSFRKENRQFPLNIFEFANGDKIRNIRTRFPRLRTVALMTNIEQAMDAPGSMNLKDGLPTELSQLNECWYQKVEKAGALQSSCLLISNVPFENDGTPPGFSSRPGIYKFDLEILEPYIARYNAKVIDIGRQQRNKALGLKTTASAPDQKSKFEEYLDEMVATDGEKITKLILDLTFARASKEEINSTFNEMTPQGKQKYRHLLGR